MFEDIDVAALVDQLMGVVTEYGLRVIGALAILIIGRLIAKRIRKTVDKRLAKRGIEATLAPFVSGMVYWLLMAVVLVAVLNGFGAQPTGLVAILGAAGLAVGLALQGTLSNFASGVMLLIFRPYSVGDLIEAAGVEAVVEAIGLFSTTLNTKDNVKIHIPNGEIYGSVIKNLTANETRRVDMVFGVSYDDDLGVAKSTIERVLGDNPLVLEQPAPDVEVFELGDSSVNFLVRPWVKTDNYWEAHFSVHHELKEGLEAAGCSFPYPQREVHMHEM